MCINIHVNARVYDGCVPFYIPGYGPDWSGVSAVGAGGGLAIELG